MKLLSGTTVKIFTTEMHHSILPTTKGEKLTNALTHDWHLDALLKAHTEKYPTHKTCYIHTDRCACQYACGENIFNKIQLAKKYNITIHVLFCVPRTGKCCCDGAGKVLKYGVGRLVLSETSIVVNDGIDFYKVAKEYFATPRHAQRNKEWEENQDGRLVMKRASVDSNHFSLHCANAEIFNEARDKIGDVDDQVFEHTLPSKSFYSNIKSFKNFSHFKCNPDGTASNNLNHCRCSNCEDGNPCLHPKYKGAIHALAINKVDTKGGEVTCDEKKTTKMELTQHEEGGVSTIGKNGNEARALNKGTIVVNLEWDEAAEKASIQVGVLQKDKSLNAYIYRRDENDEKCFHRSEPDVPLKELLPLNIKLATINGSNTIPTKIQVDDKLLGMINAIILEEEQLHEPRADLPMIYSGRGARMRVRNVRFVEE